jgi:hypothetical protein
MAERTNPSIFGNRFQPNTMNMIRILTTIAEDHAGLVIFLLADLAFLLLVDEGRKLKLYLILAVSLI